jgi:hypothetical protein
MVGIEKRWGIRPRKCFTSSLLSSLKKTKTGKHLAFHAVLTRGIVYDGGITDLRRIVQKHCFFPVYYGKAILGGIRCHSLLHRRGT